MKHEAEDELLAAIERDPKDAATRTVYADWLEQHGFDLRAEFVRSDDVEGDLDLRARLGAGPDDAAWRSKVARAPIAKCVTMSFSCPKSWDALEASAPGQRFCRACDQVVYFVATVDEAHQRGANGQCIAIDAALARDSAISAYERAASPRHVKMGMIAMPRDLPPPIAPTSNPPAPSPPAPHKPGVLDKIRGWFTR